MANRYLIASGDSENPAIYDGGTFPAVNDVLRLNGFTWTVTANRTLAELRADGTGTARCVIINNGVTLTCTTLVLGTGAQGMIGGVAGGTCTVISPLFVGGGLVQADGTETVNLIGNGDTAGTTPGWFAIRGAGTVNFTGTYNNPSSYLYDSSFGGIFNVTGIINQNGGLGIWVRGPFTMTVNGPIQNAAIPFIDNMATNYPPFVHNGSVIAGTAPVIRTRSPYYGSGPFVNNGEVMALECSRVRLLGTDNQWSMIKSDGSAQTLRTAGLLTGYPLESKVEDGTVYGPSNEFEGTLEPWDEAFAQALATAQRDLQLPSILSAITQP